MHIWRVTYLSVDLEKVKQRADAYGLELEEYAKTLDIHQQWFTEREEAERAMNLHTERRPRLHKHELAATKGAFVRFLNTYCDKG